MFQSDRHGDYSLVDPPQFVVRDGINYPVYQQVGGNGHYLSRTTNSTVYDWTIGPTIGSESAGVVFTGSVNCPVESTGLLLYEIFGLVSQAAGTWDVTCSSDGKLIVRSSTLISF